MLRGGTLKTKMSILKNTNTKKHAFSLKNLAYVIAAKTLGTYCFMLVKFLTFFNFCRCDFKSQPVEHLISLRKTCSSSWNLLFPLEKQVSAHVPRQEMQNIGLQKNKRKKKKNIISMVVYLARQKIMEMMFF